MKVLFFGQLKDVIGRADETISNEGLRTVGDLFEQYASRFPRLRGLSASIMVARNQEFAERSDALSDGDEIAFLPPVSGGSGPYTHVLEGERHFAALTREPIDSEALKKNVLRGEDGAVVCFEGVVRNNTKGRATQFLDYECYEGMAVKLMADLSSDLVKNFAVDRVAMVHRLGRMEIGEASVVIVVSAPHRRPAFDAALEGINRLKKTVPIWKKEHFVDGEVWVEGEWDSALTARTKAASPDKTE